MISTLGSHDEVFQSDPNTDLCQLTFATGGRYSTFLRNLSLRYPGFSVPSTGLGSILPILVGHFPQKTWSGGDSHPRTPGQGSVGEDGRRQRSCGTMTMGQRDLVLLMGSSQHQDTPPVPWVRTFGHTIRFSSPDLVQTCLLLTFAPGGCYSTHVRNLSLRS